MVVSRRRSTAAPHDWQAVKGPLILVSHSMVVVHGQSPCNSVTSFQWYCLAITSSAGNQFPATESPTRATVSFGCTVSPYTHPFGVADSWSTRQPCCQYSGAIDMLASLIGGSTALAGGCAAVPASTAAPA